MDESSNHYQPRGWHNRGYLPHFDGKGTTQAVTFRLADSLPSSVIEGWSIELDHKADSDRRSEMSRRINDWLDAGHGACVLRQPVAATIVQDALLHFEGVRYNLHNWCVMPNHVHVMIEQVPEWSLSAVVHSWKSFTANAINRAFQRTGALWMPDYFDRFIRDDAHWRAAMAYIDMNPVKAGLCASPAEWPWCAKGYARQG